MLIPYVCGWCPERTAFDSRDAWLGHKLDTHHDRVQAEQAYDIAYADAQAQGLSLRASEKAAEDAYDQVIRLARGAA